MDIYKDVFTYKKNKIKQKNGDELIKKFNKIWDKRIKFVMALTKKNDKNATLNLLNNKRYEEYLKLLVDIGIVTSFDDALMKKMEKVMVVGKTLAQHFKDYTTRGYCESMSVALSTIFEKEFTIKNATLHTPLIKFYHQWLECEGKVYDTTKHLIFPIDYYYDIYMPENIHKLTNEEIDKIKNDIYYRISVCDFKRK